MLRLDYSFITRGRFFRLLWKYLFSHHSANAVCVACVCVCVCNVGDERIDSIFCPVSTSLRCNLWWRSSRRPYRRGREGERETHTHSPKYRLGPRAKPPSFAFSRLPSLTSSMEAVGFCSIRHCALEQQTSSSCGLSVADFGSSFPLKQRT